MTSRMADPVFAKTQREGLYAPHVAPVNRLVDRLRDAEGRGWAPHVAPVHGGVHARLLWILRDPGPATVDPNRQEAGFLCAENADPTAARLCELLDLAAVDTADTLPWNACPWFINRAPSRGELRAGTEPLNELLGLVRELEVVLLLGNHAADAWELLAAAHPAAAARPVVLRTRHTGRQAFIGKPEQKAVWTRQQEDAFRQAGHVLRAAKASG